ncbi:alpha-2-macroglobulin family protein [Mameliella alba]|nr:alpha-2-macroglobulin family protein [Mameliella alba]MBY6167786.1 alpha-2-macroglobulin family protein [Mameliella alba]MBY6172807.1 alpha-2-macroglobulin family protein [Mameliella alba]
MRRFALGLAVAILGMSSVHAEEPVPERRYVVTRDLDYVGTDLQSLFDTSLDACQTACLDTEGCIAFTFNSRNNSCFPKSEVSDRASFEGAVSGRVVTTPSEVLDRARTRVSDLGFLSERDLERALAEAKDLAVRHGGGQWTVRTLLDAATKARDSGDMRDAIHWTGAALAQNDDPALWLQYGQWSTEYLTKVQGADKRKYTNRAFLASVNAYLRAGEDAHRITALYDMARALEADKRGRLMIPALRLAETIAPRADVSALLDDAIGKYGFRVDDHIVEADTAAPRICASFNEPLVRVGQDYAPYVKLPDPRLAVVQDDERICVTGVEHGARYTITFRAGLPAKSGEELARDVPITAYVSDRTPTLGFPGRAYVLPRTADAGLPIETVNLDEVELVLRRVSDRNLIRAMQENYFGSPLGRYDEEYLARDVAEEIWRGTGVVENRLNADMLTRLPMGDVLGDLPAGIYALTAAVPDPKNGEGRRATQWFILSDIGLTTMQGTDGLTVFARNLGDASAIVGLEVTLLAEANRVLETVTTDADGVARFAPGLLRGTGGTAPALIMAKRGDEDLAFLSLTDPAFDLSDRGVAGRAPAGPLDAFLATDRGIYRAGDVVNVTALLRDAHADAVSDVPLTAVLTRPDGVEYSRHISDGGDAGGHVFALPLGPGVPRGTWRLAVFADPKGKALTSDTVLVEDFVPERIDFDLSLPEGPINPLSPPLLEVDARYLFGAPGADLNIDGELRLSTSSRMEAFPGYRFGRHDDSALTRIATFDADLTTDDTGAAQLTLPMPDVDPKGRPMTATATLRLSEASGRPVERRITRSVAPPTPMIGIKPAAEEFAEGAEARFEVIAIGPDLQPQAMDIGWQVNRVRTRYQWYQNYGNWYWEPVTTRETVAKGTGTLGADPLKIAAEVDWGEYEIVVTRADGAYLAASMGFSAGWYAPADASDAPDMLELSLDKPAYGPGETATLRMVPRYAGKALITVLADRVVSMQAIDVVEGENTLALPVTEDWGAGVYVTAQVIRPMDVTAGQNPARALGLTHAAVDPGDARLAVGFDVPEESAPRSPLVAKVRIDNVTPGEMAYVTVAAVDLGILNVTGFDTPDPAGHYFGQRRLGVEIRDIYGRLIDGMNGAMGSVRSGGDADAGVRMQSPPPTEAMVAFFSGLLPVAQDGTVEARFDIPDFNGTVRLMAVAWSPKGVGSAETDVLIRDPVVISASLPRFLSPGDQSRLLVELTHAKGPVGQMPLVVSADGLALDTSALPANVTLSEGAKATFEVPLTAKSVGDHKIRVVLTTPDGDRLTKDLTLGVRSNDPDVGATRRFQLAAGETFTLTEDVFANLRTSGASALVSAGPLARFDAPGLLASLDRYPYGCTEQVTSKALPLLYMSAIAEPLGLGNKDRIDLRIEQSVAKVLTRQASNGAFGLWGAYSGDFWLDAYVTDFLSRARSAGYDVPQIAWQNAIDNLKNRIAYAPDFDEGGEDIAYALMVLAREGEAAMGDLRYYADEKAESFATPLAQAQLGAALASYGDQLRADEMFGRAAERLFATPVAQKRGYRLDYGSTVRDAAGLLTLAVEARSDRFDRNDMIRRISSVDRPLSTQEKAWALMAAHAMVQDPTVSGLALDGAALTGPFVRRIEAEGLQPVQLTNTSDKPTDITLTTLGKPIGATEATGFGYALTREYFTLEGDPVDEIRAGDRMVVVLTVKPADKENARLILDDALPAGFEIDNPNILRSGDIRALDWLELSDATHTEFRSDRFLAALDREQQGQMRLAYIVRAVSPGTFHHPAALVEDMYRPEYRAVTASGSVTVLP